MVKTELSYNPYLLVTTVTFNGNPPRINSLVERYSSGKLQDWIEELPHVFHDEMNGYDFELAFTGTELDFDELRQSFTNAGIGMDLVRLFHKGRIGSRPEKIKELNLLLTWLDENPCAKFDWPSFKRINKELFEEVYPLIVISNPSGTDSFRDSEGLFEGIEISKDMVESVDELRKTDLSSTPILIVVDKQSSTSISRILQSLLERNDVTQEQLFFLIKYDFEKIVRLIRDLGVVKPQTVSSVNDRQILRYLELYPVSERIHDSVCVLRQKLEDINGVLVAENNLSEIANEDVHERIRGLEDRLRRLEGASNVFANRDNLDRPAEFATARTKLINDISHWRAKKTKIVKIDDAKKLAQEYDEKTKIFFAQFTQEVRNVLYAEYDRIRANAREWYLQARYDEDFSAKAIAKPFLIECSLPDITSNLMEIKNERYVTPKDDLLGKIFRNAAVDSGEQVLILETEFYCERWRSYVEGAISPIADDCLRDAYTELCRYYDQISGLYLKHIKDLINITIEEKKSVTAQLSEGERLQQADNDWYSAFCDKLYAIERF